MIGLDPCSTGEPLEVVVSGLELAARYDLAGSACIVEVGCDVPWLSLWIVTEEQACTWPGDGEHVDRLSSDRGYALCLVAAPEQPGDIGACWLQTTDQSYGVVVDNPVDNFCRLWITLLEFRSDESTMEPRTTRKGASAAG
jgi:hypothetical protein